MIKSTVFLFLILFVFGLSGNVYAWDGTNDRGEMIEIESGNLVRSGNDIEIYNWSTGTYSGVEVESIYRYGSSVEIEVYNWNTGAYETLEMD